jgi:hypothetical protein
MTQLIKPEYYGGEENPYEVIKVCEAWGLDKDAYLFNVIKYIARSNKKHKKPYDDLCKALYYLERKIKNIEYNNEYEVIVNNDSTTTTMFES